MSLEHLPPPMLVFLLPCLSYVIVFLLVFFSMFLVVLIEFHVGPFVFLVGGFFLSEMG